MGGKAPIKLPAGSKACRVCGDAYVDTHNCRGHVKFEIAHHRSPLLVQNRRTQVQPKRNFNRDEPFDKQ
jgi:hypothetical protein